MYYSEEDEAKLLLWWMEWSFLWLRQLDFGSSPLPLITAAQQLVASLHQLGEDRSSAGFLGVIGLGKRSQLSPRYVAARPFQNLLAIVDRPPSIGSPMAQRSG